jgi:hypothetical protein
MVFFGYSKHNKINLNLHDKILELKVYFESKLTLI